MLLSTAKRNFTNMSTKPKVSVVMPIFRHSKGQLITAISSLLNQTFRDLEVIIVDGSSDNNNFEIISSINDNRIKYFRTKGYINCLNYGIEQAKGLYIARMDDDDISLPTRIEEQVLFMDNNPNVSLCSCLVEFFGEKTGVSSHVNELTLLNLINKQEFVHPAMMFRKDINLRYENVKPAEDCLMFRKLLLKGYKFAILNKILYKSYVSSNSIMVTYPKYFNFLLSKINIWTLAEYYNFNLSFIDKFFSSKSFSKQEIIEYMQFALFLKQKLKQTKSDLAQICLPFFSYMISKNKSKLFLLHEQLFYQTVFPLALKLFLKKSMKTIFSLKNEYSNAKKRKVLCVFGIKFKFLCNKLPFVK